MLQSPIKLIQAITDVQFLIDDLTNALGNEHIVERLQRIKIKLEAAYQEITQEKKPKEEEPRHTGAGDHTSSCRRVGCPEHEKLDIDPDRDDDSDQKDIDEGNV